MSEDPELKGLLCKECGTQVTREEPNPDDEQEQMWYCPKCDWWYHSVKVVEPDREYAVVKGQVKDSRKVGVAGFAIALIVIVVAAAVGAVIVNEMVTMYNEMPQMPEGYYTVLDKRVTEVTPWGQAFFLAPLFKYQCYQFQFANSTYGWVEVTEEFYYNYSIGDTCPSGYMVFR